MRPARIAGSCALPCDQDNNFWAMVRHEDAGAGMMGGGAVGGMMEPGVDGFMAGYLSVAGS